MRIGIIGFGHMGKAIFRSLFRKGFKGILKSDGGHNKKVVEKSNIIIICVKPSVIPEVLKEISPFLKKESILISIAAGIPLSGILKNLQNEKKIHGVSVVRVMPNLPVQIGMGMSVWKSHKPLPKRQKNAVKRILRAFGEEIEVEDENLINAATAVSGSGPAYVFAFLAALQSAGQKLGFSKDVARLLALQTVLGSSEFAKKSPDDFSLLAKHVQTKGGTTEAAFKILKKAKWEKNLERAIFNAYKRARTLAFSREN